MGQFSSYNIDFSSYISIISQKKNDQSSAVLHKSINPRPNGPTIPKSGSRWVLIARTTIHQGSDWWCESGQAPGVSGEPESRAMVDPFETGEWWFFNVFHGIFCWGYMMRNMSLFFGLIMFRLNDWKWLMDGQGYCWWYLFGSSRRESGL